MKTVLFIEDELDYRDPVVKRLGEEGFEVYCAEDGKEALDIIKENNIDLVLLDLLLPRMDGVEFLYILRNDLEKDIPVIILSNLDSHPNKNEVAEYLVKANVTIEELVKKVAEYTV